ncbi:transglycosylase domain-containing protein [Actinacidiphila glaucinigra]|uniref:transglycosylase domain-containing protein n=1 Tax=Actinacidiphila glaucinigra TaxID=235986 RepID=UPI002DDBF4B5|nr:transglycosylase domain-containing protein [Actinacidiphila glaucinigra]WSD60981.1 transglycosylase domain-containing protein [Actinacidiphila glaucinigra]
MGHKRSRPTSSGGTSSAQQAAKFLGISVLAGVVLAGIALPAAGALGLSAKGTAAGFDSLPGELKRPPLSQSTQILDTKGDLIATVYSRDRRVVGLDKISKPMQQAIVAIEDARFYEHGAIDVKGILRALNKNAQEGGVSEGASTLTQQYVKNVFVEEAGDDPTKVQQATQQTLGRKIKEMKYAIQLEQELGKQKILENYLNITFFGEQAYGVESASRRYFSKSAKNLSLTEAALLAGLVQSPSRYDPVNDPEEAKKRRDVVLQRMADVKDITQAEADEGKKKPLGLKITQPKNGCITAVNGAGFFCDYVRQVFLSDKTFGKTKGERSKRWDQGGLTIRTTLDPKAQRAVQDSISRHVYKSDDVATAVTLVQPGTGKIVGMGQSRPYGFKKNQTQINLSVNQSMGGGVGYQPGSTFKPITAAAAIEQGTDPATSYPSPYKMTYPSPVTTCGGNWVNTEGSTVENENESEKGPYSLREATAKSVNTFYVQLISDIGVCPVVKMAKSMGIDRANGKALTQVPSLTLGSQEVSPLTMANAYATFANKGVYCSPVAIESITDANGKKLKVPQSKCKRAMTEQTAATLNTLLKGVVEDGTGQEAGLSDRDSAGKTGTTDERYAAWFVGYTSDMAGAVWVGDPAHKRHMTDITIGGVYHAKVFGADTPGPIWRDAMSGALTGTSSGNLPTVAIREPEKPRDDDDHGPGDDGPGNGGNGNGGGNGGDEGLFGGIFGGGDGGDGFTTGGGNGRGGATNTGPGTGTPETGGTGPG